METWVIIVGLWIIVGVPALVLVGIDRVASAIKANTKTLSEVRDLLTPHK